MNASEKLLEFLRAEIDAEERSGFARLSRVPESIVMARLQHYRSLDDADKAAFKECAALWAHACYGFIFGAEKMDHTKHPYFPQWASTAKLGCWNKARNVPLMRGKVRQHKLDAARGVPSRVTQGQFEQAAAIHSVKAPELRQRVRAALEPLGYYRTDEEGFYCCRQGRREFRVNVDYAGRLAQLRYVVVRPDLNHVPWLMQFRFERALGFGQGDWDYIVEENVADVFSLFTELVAYSYELPDRIRAALA